MLSIEGTPDVRKYDPNFDSEDEAPSLERDFSETESLENSEDLDDQ